MSATVLFAGGGSGGHLYPGIAVAEVLTRHVPDLCPVFLCTKREIDSTILKSTPFEFIQQPIVPPRRSVGGLINFWRGWRSTQDLVRSIFKERKPAAVLGLGGYAAGVTVKVRGAEKMPAAILNPDVIPGKANQFLFNSVQKVCCQFEATSKHVSEQHQSKLIATGCPIRTDITMRPSHAKASMTLGLDASLHTLVVTGASQGAVTVNQADAGNADQDSCIRSIAPGLAGACTWPAKTTPTQVTAEYRELEMPAVVLDFTPAMADVWAVADLAVARAGASTLPTCGLWRAGRPDAVSVSQGSTPACQRESSGGCRRVRGCAGSARSEKQCRCHSRRSSKGFSTMFHEERRCRRRRSHWPNPMPPSAWRMCCER